MTYPEESTSRFRRQRADLAIMLATQSRWQEAVQANRDVLQVFPNDVDALNRLGKASIELGRYGDARDAYGKAVSLEPSNTIARKNLARLAGMKETTAEVSGAGARVDPSLFIEEAGKTAVLALLNLGSRDAVGKTTAGDMLEIKPTAGSVSLHTLTGEYLGQLDPKTSSRLTTLLSKGNRYEAAVTSATEQQVRVILREVYQSPDMAGRPSFPVRADTTFRPYIKDSVLQYGLDEEEDEEEMFREDEEDTTEWEEPAEESPFVSASALPREDADDDEDEEE
jgi:tetratricopeptide (TPR) repeat protein